jgi:general secretion pathway protein L
MSSLVIWLGAEAGPQVRYPYVTSRDGIHTHRYGQAPAALLPDPGRGGEVVAIVPATGLSWHEVRLPKGVGHGSPRLRQVLEGLLEDKLLSELADTHFALGPPSEAAGDKAWVAACDRGWLRSHLQALEAAHHPVSRIVPELAPKATGLGVHITGDAQLPWLLATGAGVRGVLSMPLSPGALQLLPPLAAQAAPGDGDTDTDITAEPSVVESAETVLQVPLRLQTRADRLMAAAQSDWDLAQMEFASTGWARASKRAGSVWRNLLHGASWRPLRWGLVLLVGVNLVGVNALAWKVQREHTQRKQAMAEVLTRTFPQVRVVVDAPVQMAREVALLRQATGAAPGRPDAERGGLQRAQ